MITDSTKMKSKFGVRKNIVDPKYNLPIQKALYVPQITLAYLQFTQLVNAIYGLFLKFQLNTV